MACWLQSRGSLLRHALWHFLAIEGIGLIIAFLATRLLARFVTHFLSEIPIHSESPYFRAMAPGIIAFRIAFLGCWTGKPSYLCPDLIGGSEAYRCHPHPHNYFIQMMGEAGILASDRCFILWVDNLGLCKASYSRQE